MKKFLLILGIFTILISTLTGCLSNKSNGIPASDELTAEEYMTDNPQLIEKYGESYTFVLNSGGGVGEKNFWGLKGEMSFEYIVNDKDTYSVLIKKERRGNWEVQGFLCLSCKYECDEVGISFDSRNQNWPGRDSVSNGVLEVGGIKKDVIITLTANRLNIIDPVLWESYVNNEEDITTTYRTEWYEGSRLLVCDVAGQMDEFTATVQPEYQDYLGEDLTVLRFHAVE